VCVGDAGLELFEERHDERVLRAEACQKSKIDVDGLSRLAPSLKRHAANEAEAPPSRFTAPLQGVGGAEDFKNGASSS
jgi:hypothetical protein